LNRLPLSLNEIETYGEQTASSLLYLTLELLDVRDVTADHAASHIGKAAAIVTLLKALPHHLQQGHVYLPGDLVAQQGINIGNMLRGEIDHVKV
jgi:NADH dehydrogenase [ubiquinone] 1 alpha subcomplex assembly factor 6